MRYLSLFSGIEMASLAWGPLGWQLVAVAEVDQFASAVIAHHHPGIPNLGDVSAVSESAIEGLGHIDVVIGGFPCQDLSVAGKRRGLRDDDGNATRSGLFFDAMRLVRASRARWLVIENVPGLFSSNEGRDFGAVVAEIVGCTFGVPADGWQAAGAAVGPRGAVCWRTLDAQWFGLAQRRERVFFVADLGEGAHTAPVFPLLESVSGDTPPCVAARTRPPRRATGRPRRQGIWEQVAAAFRQGAPPRPTRIAGCLDSASGRPDDNDAQAGRLVPSVAGTLNANGKAAGSATQQDAEAGMLVITPLAETTKRAGKKGSKKDGSGLGAPGDPMFTLGADSRHGVALAYGGNNTEGPIEVATACNAHGGPTGRLDFESETFVAEVAHSLRGNSHDASEDGSGRTTVIPMLAAGAHGANGLGIGQPGDPAMTLDSTGASAIAFNARQNPEVYGNLAGALGNQHAGTDNAVGIPFDTQITSGENRCNPKAGDTGHPLSSTAHPPAYATLYEVRRLMPVECCRLMGVSDSYFELLWKGKPPADGNVYKTLGNGFAVPCILWIGQRIESACVPA